MGGCNDGDGILCGSYGLDGNARCLELWRIMAGAVNGDDMLSTHRT